MDLPRIPLHIRATVKRLGLAFVTLLVCHIGPKLQADLVVRPMNGVELERQALAEKTCAQQMVRILWAAQIWATDNADMPPPGLQAMTNEIRDPWVLFCPAVFHETIPTNWTKVDWTEIDYKWIESVDWTDPLGVACVCAAHNHVGRADGSVGGSGGYRAGWPLLAATPHDVFSTPGEAVTFELKLAPDTEQPVTYQWRRAYLDYTTNITRVEDIEQPGVFYWVTNVVPVFPGTNLPGQTNPSLTIQVLEPNHSGYYSVAISNSLGVTLSRQVWLDVSPSYSGIATNDAYSDALCANNLRQIGLCAAIWGQSRNHLLPHSLGEMTDSQGEPLFGWPIALFCRADTNRVAPESWSGVAFDNTSYEIPQGDWADPFAVFCRCRVHGYYLTADGVIMLKPYFVGTKRVGTDSVELRFRTFAGKENLLETSEDLSNWSVLSTYGPFPDDVRFTDLTTKKQGFYRLRLQ